MPTHTMSNLNTIRESVQTDISLMDTIQKTVGGAQTQFCLVKIGHFQRKGGGSRVGGGEGWDKTYET